MKNIRILPTDKPSRLWFYKQTDILLTGLTVEKSRDIDTQNIYITNSEEIKANDFYIHNKSVVQSAGGEVEKGDYKNCQKIILSTDQDLIKDGVQSIDDEFLEWFVKNPSCEEVEVKLIKYSENHPELEGGYREEWVYYEIILPKEEQKELRRKLFTLIKSLEQEEPTQESVFENAKSSLKKYLFDNKEKVVIDLEQMREWSNTNKQDPLEEAAKEYAEMHLDVSGTLGKYLVKAVFQDGGKWEQEQDKNKYSEEEVLEFANWCRIQDNKYPNRVTTTQQLFEQFKKK